MKTMLFACLFGVALVAQEPTLAETTAWLEAEGPGLMQSTTIDRDLGAIKKSTTMLHLQSCTLSWTGTSSIGAGPVHQTAFKVPLKDLDTGGFVVMPAGDRLQVKTRATVGSTMTGPPLGPPQPGWNGLVDRVFVPVQNADAAGRLLNAIRRAAVLCGAPASVF